MRLSSANNWIYDDPKRIYRCDSTWLDIRLREDGWYVGERDDPSPIGEHKPDTVSGPYGTLDGAKVAYDFMALNWVHPNERKDR